MKKKTWRINMFWPVWAIVFPTMSLLAALIGGFLWVGLYFLFVLPFVIRDYHLEVKKK